MGRAYQNRKESMAKTSDMKAKVYSRYGREIYVCAKAGGAEPEGNLALRGLIDRAKNFHHGPVAAGEGGEGAVALADQCGKAGDAELSREGEVVPGEGEALVRS